MELQWNNTKKCVLDTRVSWLQKSEETYKAIDYTGNDQQNRWKKEVDNVNIDEKKEKLLQIIQEQIENSHRKAKKEYLESECDKTTEFQRTGHYVLMYMKMKELDCTLWKTHLGSGNGPVGRQTAE